MNGAAWFGKRPGSRCRKPTTATTKTIIKPAIHLSLNPKTDSCRQTLIQVPAKETAVAAWVQTRVVLRIITILLAVAAVLWVLYKLTAVLLLLVLSVFFAYLVAPLVDLVEQPLKLGAKTDQDSARPGHRHRLCGSVCWRRRGRLFPRTATGRPVSGVQTAGRSHTTKHLAGTTDRVNRVLQGASHA